MLALEGITKVFSAGTDRVAAIQGIDLALDRKDFLTVIGSNGAGKSTLLNLIAGVARPTDGRIRLDGEDVTAVPAHLRARQIGRIVQDPLAGTAPSLTVVERTFRWRPSGDAEPCAWHCPRPPGAGSANASRRSTSGSRTE